ncbi:amylo-alpha-1,6-glucosidase [Limibacter armeniacum]|uniref:amylo-alpha-1,6-glucosidase n=1 Tax=Limibacter armeniacum TaxID=466084 RepID=UPI002FE5C177
MKRGIYLFMTLWLFSLVGCDQKSEQQTESKQTTNSEVLSELGIQVPTDQNREFSYTDKKSGYYYARTHHQDNKETDGRATFYGWNIATQQLFKDYELKIDGAPVDRQNANVTIYPHQAVREYKNATETFRMFDMKPVLFIKLDNIQGEHISLKLFGQQIKFKEQDKGYALYELGKAVGKTVAVSTLKASNIKVLEDGTIQDKADQSNGFIIAFGDTKENAEKLIEATRNNADKWFDERVARMEKLITDNTYLQSSSDSLDKAVKWISLTMDQLITKQMGTGIYAGLPWFNDYWGRDLFIAVPGATLVTGQFNVAREILLSFAKFQNKDEGSKYYGRVPNRARPDDIIYNTTDGTPRFVIELLDYIKYSGDTTLIEELYPAVKRSIEGPIHYWVDQKGYLTHEDADTWMDAKIDNKIPWSPRGNRANDIQALWYDQLRAGAYFAKVMGEKEDQKEWTALADKLQKNFEKDFFDKQHHYMADRINKDNKKDFSIRPNQLFALKLVKRDETKMEITKTAWENLVFPWGVASLDQKHEDFHPYHENPEFYHKDAAYHNGTIWQWNNGIAMQRMIELGQQDMAFELFKNMNRDALTRDGVGSIAENADALPREGKILPKLTGTFLQAWSNSEHLRVWYQYFLGIRPNAIENKITLAPRVPTELTQLKYQVKVFDGTLKGEVLKEEAKTTYFYHFNGITPTIKLEMLNYAPTEVILKEGQALKVTTNGDGFMNIETINEDNSTDQLTKVGPDKKELSRQQNINEFFKDIKFAEPLPLNPQSKALSGKGVLRKERMEK